MCIFFFFFSSRRRHTRFDCDWSSDVCSSDLGSSNSTTPARFAARTNCLVSCADTTEQVNRAVAIRSRDITFSQPKGPTQILPFNLRIGPEKRTVAEEPDFDGLFPL